MTETERKLREREFVRGWNGALAAAAVRVLKANEAGMVSGVEELAAVPAEEEGFNEAEAKEEMNDHEKHELRQIAARCLAELAVDGRLHDEACARRSVDLAESLMKKFKDRGYLPGRPEKEG